VTAAAVAGLTVTVAVANFVVSVLLVAITDAVIPLVTLGAVYLPVASTVPGVELLLLTVQVTPAFDESFVTVAVNCVVPPDATVAVVGEIVTEIVFPEFVVLPPPHPEMPEMNESNTNANKRDRLVENSFRMMAFIRSLNSARRGLPGRTGATLLTQACGKVCSFIGRNGRAMAHPPQNRSR